VHRSERYGEKLATPDVKALQTLIGDMDPVKAREFETPVLPMKEVIHYGIHSTKQSGHIS
jgi:magnesium chelatase subunit I